MEDCDYVSDRLDFKRMCVLGGGGGAIGKGNKLEGCLMINTESS